MNKKQLRALLILVMIPGLAQFLFAQDATALIKKSENAIRGRTVVAKYKITIKTRRWTRTMKMKSWESRKDNKSFAEITAPKKDAGTRFLLKNKTMKQYIPKLSQVITITPSMMLQSWMGSDFTNDDIVKESSKVKDYTHTLDGTETVTVEGKSHKCYKIILKPKPGAAVVWGKIFYYLRVKDSLPVKEEFYNERGDLKKVMTCSNFKQMHGRVIPTKYKMNTLRKKDRYTVMEITQAYFNVQIPDYIFTLQHLKRR